MSSTAASAAALKKDLLALALKHSPDGSLPVDALRRVLDAANLAHATEHMRYLMVKDARMQGGFAELDHSSPNGSKLAGEADALSRNLEVTSFSDVRLLNGVTEIEATVVLGKCELHFKFRRQPKAHGTSMPRHGLMILVDDTPEWIDLDEEEVGEDEQQEEDGMLPSFKKKPTTVLEYTISATNLTTPATPRSILAQVLLYGFDPSGTPSPLGAIDPSKHEEDGREEGDAQQQKDVCTVGLCDVTLEHAIEWAGTALSTEDFLSFLFLFPYHEEEWDIGNLALDQLLDSDEGSGDESGEDEEKEFDSDYESEREEWAPPPKSATKKKEQVKREHQESKDNKQGKSAKKRKA